MEFNLVLVFLLVSFYRVNCFEIIENRNNAINSSYLEEVIDAQECDRQVKVIRRNAFLLLQFADSGLRTPRGILTGNAVDLGNYHQCLEIDHESDEMHIQGKYCSIGVPVDQQFHLPRLQDLDGLAFNPSSLRVDNTTIENMEKYDRIQTLMKAFGGDFKGLVESRSIPNNPLSSMVFRLSVCVPKPCTTEQAITSLFFNVSRIGFNYTDHYCRLPNDKPWVAADIVAISFFSVLGFLTLVSTFYDIGYRFVLKKDVKQMTVLCRSFSVYTNGQILTTFKSNPANLQCVDGIRTLAMLWVIVGHSYSTEPFIANPRDSSTWMFTANALWITAATMTVDTFFTMAGVLLVYTTAGKMSQMAFVKSLHWFYLNRFMRVTPMLAVAVILQASYYNQIVDGPHWVTVADHVQRCRDNWLMTMLHVQNFIAPPEDMCVTHSWYVAIDFQLYVVSPLILFWVFSGKSRTAWSSLLGGLAVVLAIATGYCFYMDLPGGVLQPARFSEFRRYYIHYYFNTLPRSTPFFVGLVFGYLLHVYRKKPLKIPTVLVIACWACAAGILSGIFYYKYRIKQMDWDNKLIDNLMNSFMRPAYACAICWLIIACHHGYAGPVNWLLSLDIWRLPARLTYGMFIFHYPLMYTLNATMVVPIYFSVERFFFKFLSYAVLAVAYSFFFTLTVDTPIAVLFKQLMDAAKPKPKAGKENKAVNDDVPEKINDEKSEVAITDVKVIDTKDVAPSTTNIDVESNEPQSTKDIEIGSSEKETDYDVVRIDDTGIRMDSEKLNKEIQ